MTFHKSTRNHIEKRLLSVWKYKIHCYIFCVFAHSEVISQIQQSGMNEWRRSFIPLYHALVNQSMFCSEFSSTLLVPFPVLGAPTKVYQKSGMVPLTIQSYINIKVYKLLCYIFIVMFLVVAGVFWKVARPYRSLRGHYNSHKQKSMFRNCE